MTWLEVTLGIMLALNGLLVLRLHAELDGTRRERDDLLKQLKALLTVYGNRVDRRRERE